MLARLDVGADARLFHLVIDDNLVGIAIQRHALSKLIFGRNDNLFATRELNRALGCTTVRVELAYGMLLHVRPNLESCHVIDHHAKVVLAVYVLPAELNHVLAVAGNQILCGRGYGKLSKRNGRLSSRNNDNVVPIGRTEGKGCPIVAP